MVELAYQPAIAILIDLYQIDTAGDHGCEGGGCGWAMALIAFRCVYAMRTDACAIHQDDGVAVSNSVYFQP